MNVCAGLPNGEVKWRTAVLNVILRPLYSPRIQTDENSVEVYVA